MERGFCVAPPVCGLCFLGRRIGLGFGQPSHPVEHGTADPCLGLLVGQGLGVQGVAQDMFVVPRILSAVDRQGLRDALAGGLINAYVQPLKSGTMSTQAQEHVLARTFPVPRMCIYTSESSISTRLCTIPSPAPYAR